MKRVNKTDTWLTPKDFYDKLNDFFWFDEFDPCPPDHDINEWDGTEIEWKAENAIFLNPPWSAALKTRFVEKAVREVKAANVPIVVCLLPVSTSTRLFHGVIKPNAREITFLEGRLKFEGIDKEGNWVNPGKGRYLLKGTEGLPTIQRSGQIDQMVVIF